MVWRMLPALVIGELPPLMGDAEESGSLMVLEPPTLDAGPMPIPPPEGPPKVEDGAPLDGGDIPPDEPDDVPGPNDEFIPDGADPPLPKESNSCPAAGEEVAL